MDLDSKIFDMDALRKKLLDKMGGHSGSYSESNLRQYWMPDQVAVECYECAAKFTTFRRKHHCRICGQIFCSRCCGNFICGRFMNFNGSIRVCNPCHRFIEENPPQSSIPNNSAAGELQSSASSSNRLRRASFVDIEDNLRFSHLATKSGSESDLSVGARKASYAGIHTFMSDSCDNIAQKKPLDLQKLLEVWQKLSATKSLLVRSHKYKLKVYQDTFLGEELLQWLYESEGMTERQSAIDLAQGLLDGELISDPTIAQYPKDNLSGVFNKSVPYRLKENKNHEAIAEESEAPEWLQSLDNQPVLHYKQEIKRKVKTSESTSSPANHEDLNQIFGADLRHLGLSSDIPSPALDEIYQKHHDFYLDQLLRVEKLDNAKWTEFIKENCEQILQEIEMEPSFIKQHIQMDVRDLAKIKCICEGKQSQSRIIKGEVFSNRVIRTDMPMRALNAKLLLIKDSISYHRQDKMESIANLHLVEDEFVKNTCNKIKNLRPDLILVGENIVRKAQDELAKAGISVIQNVKLKNLERVSRFFGAQILPNLGSVVNIPTLGTCEKFHCVYYERQDKNVVYLEGSQTPKQWGCCFLLRGGTRHELAKVKRVMKQFLLLKTHATFEKAFILDESSQVDNFIVPDYKSSHITRLTMSPFIDLPLPEDDFVKDIDEDCAAQQNGQDEYDAVEPPAPAYPKVEPLVLAKTLKNDVKMRNLVADMRAAPVIVRPVTRPQLEPLKPPPRIYEVLNRSLPICYSSFLSNIDGGGAKYCVKPWVKFMKFYGEFDLPLGVFLMSYCFDKSVRCLSTQDMPNLTALPKSANPCQISIINHGRTFCLGNTSATLIVQDMNSKIIRTKDKDQIVMWKFCTDCNTMTEVLPLSGQAWKMSYGMFLLLLMSETKIVRRDYLSCTHSLHNQQCTVFAHHNQIAFFKMQRIFSFGVKMPPEKIRLPEKIIDRELKEELIKLSCQGSAFYGQLNEKLVQLQNDFSSASASMTGKISEMTAEQQQNFGAHKQKVEKINQLLQTDLIQAQSDILMLKISIMKDFLCWRGKISKFFELKKKEEKLMSKTNVKSRAASGNNLLSNEEQQHMSLPAMMPTSGASSNVTAPLAIERKISEQEFGNVDNPFSNTLHPDLYLKPFILVDENQPSSIIAYALGSTEHAEFLFRGDSKKHLDHSFSDNGGDDKFFVKVHFAAEFHNFRKKIFEDVHDHQDFLASLSRCDPWQSSGGKSGASFYKTADGRFLLKQLNNHELDNLKKNVTKYFAYITQKRSLMAKIVGLYTVGYKTGNGGVKFDLVVLENLFHNRKISESYDLKGSMRNRFVDSNNLQGDKELVLMDENLLRMACENPFYVSHKTKNELKNAVESDAAFLCDIKVMDYSLLVGKDLNTNELVVGIIDYLRPFSIDKIIESQVKKTSGYFQGNVEDPTVISPSAYQSRFISAMDNYFVLLPDYWYDTD